VKVYGVDGGVCPRTLRITVGKKLSSAIVCAVMQENGIEEICSFDGDRDALEGIRRTFPNAILS